MKRIVNYHVGVRIYRIGSFSYGHCFMCEYKGILYNVRVCSLLDAKILAELIVERDNLKQIEGSLS